LNAGWIPTSRKIRRALISFIASAHLWSPKAQNSFPVFKAQEHIRAWGDSPAVELGVLLASSRCALQLPEGTESCGDKDLLQKQCSASRERPVLRSLITL